MLNECGFCLGGGEVRRSSELAFSTCQVCSGRGTVYREEPIITCAFCEGTGIQPKREPSVLCPDCLGRGKAIDRRVYRLTCKGKGRVEVKKECGVIG